MLLQKLTYVSLMKQNGCTNRQMCRKNIQSSNLTIIKKKEGKMKKLNTMVSKLVVLASMVFGNYCNHTDFLIQADSAQMLQQKILQITMFYLQYTKKSKCLELKIQMAQ